MLRIQCQRLTKESFRIRIIQSNKSIEDNLYGKRTEVY
jgi:hypothetical protein